MVPIRSGAPRSLSVHQAYTAHATKRKAVTTPNTLYSDFTEVSPAQLTGRASRLVGNGLVVVASGDWPMAVSASGVVFPACLAARNAAYCSGDTARSSKFIIEWNVPQNSAH